jgi:hypothetical protein
LVLTDILQAERGAIVEQVAGFPNSPTSTTTIKVTVTAEDDHETNTFTVKVRVPAWSSESNNTISVNGIAVAAASVVAGTYASITRVWKTGDVVEVNFPMEFWASPVTDDRPAFNGTMAFMFVPLLAFCYLANPLVYRLLCFDLVDFVAGATPYPPPPPSHYRPDGTPFTSSLQSQQRSGINTELHPLIMYGLRRYGPLVLAGLSNTDAFAPAGTALRPKRVRLGLKWFSKMGLFLIFDFDF